MRTPPQGNTAGEKYTTDEIEELIDTGSGNQIPGISAEWDS